MNFSPVRSHIVGGLGGLFDNILYQSFGYTPVTLRPATILKGVKKKRELKACYNLIGLARI